MLATQTPAMVGEKHSGADYRSGLGQAGSQALLRSKVKAGWLAGRALHPSNMSVPGSPPKAGYVKAR